MKIVKSFFLFALGILCCALHAYENVGAVYENDLIVQDENWSDLDKVYVTLDRLMINEDGMFILFPDMPPLPINALFSDDNGLYVLRGQLESGYSFEECPNGHPSRHGDGRCNKRGCPYFRN